VDASTATATAEPDNPMVAATTRVSGTPTVELSDIRLERPSSDDQIDLSIEGTKFLLVDDDFRNIFALSALLQRGRADVVVAESGSEALIVLEKTPDIDIVLMDIMMPGMDGYATMRAIREIDQFASLPIVAVTGKAVAGERQRCVDAGANGYVPKPVNSSELIAVISPWLHHPAGSAR
jgi:CheY-like chemotaxis protein